MTAMLLSSVTAHLWQSTLFAVAIWLITLGLRVNRARVRCWAWTAASVKFLVPVSWLMSFGARFEWHAAPAIVRPATTFLMDEILAPPVVDAVAASPQASAALWPSLLVVLWAVGSLVVFFVWLRQWRTVAAALRHARPAALEFSDDGSDLRVLSSPWTGEPGVVGIWRPVVLLPDGLAERLSPEQLRAVFAHERCHIRHHDNLTAMIHMGVEALFWCHPLVWWIERRLIDERERACDEAVLEAGSEPADYAESILTVCRWSIASPLMSVSGISGSDLRARIDAILANRAVRRVSVAGRVLLASAAVLALGGPIGLGSLHAAVPDDQAPAGERRQFDVTSIRPTPESTGPGADFMTRPGGQLIARNNPVMNLIGNAYRMPQYRIVGGPDWLRTDKYDLQAKAAGDPSTPEMMLMLQGVLEQRFKLKVHREMRDADVYLLRLVKSGLLHPAVAANCREETPGAPPPPAAAQSSLMGCGSSHLGRTPSGGLAWDAVRIDANQMASSLAVVVRGNVVNQTGITGVYDISVELPALQPTAAGTDPLSPGDASLFTVLREKLGLSLERGRAPVEFLVIDTVERPTPN